MNETLYQVEVNGIPFCEPLDVVQKNAIMRSLEGTLVNVRIIPLQPISDPVFKVIEGGRK